MRGKGIDPAVLVIETEVGVEIQALIEGGIVDRITGLTVLAVLEAEVETREEEKTEVGVEVEVGVGAEAEIVVGRMIQITTKIAIGEIQ